LVYGTFINEIQFCKVFKIEFFEYSTIPIGIHKAVKSFETFLSQLETYVSK